MRTIGLHFVTVLKKKKNSGDPWYEIDLKKKYEKKYRNKGILFYVDVKCQNVTKIK